MIQRRLSTTVSYTTGFFGHYCITLDSIDFFFLSNIFNADNSICNNKDTVIDTTITNGTL